VREGNNVQCFSGNGGRVLMHTNKQLEEIILSTKYSASALPKNSIAYGSLIPIHIQKEISQSAKTVLIQLFQCSIIAKFVVSFKNIS